MSDLISVDVNDDIAELAEEIVHREREVRAYRNNCNRYERLYKDIEPVDLTRDQVEIAKQGQQHIRAGALAAIPKADADIVMAQMRRAKYQAGCAAETEQLLVTEDALNDAKAQLRALLFERDGSVSDEILKSEVLAAKTRIEDRNKTIAAR